MKEFEQMNKELNFLFNTFNKEFYQGKLETPIITIQTNEGNRKSMGWCTTEKIWKNNESNEYYHEISISAEYLYLGLESIISTLLHEMVHLYCSQFDIKEVSRGGSYHNKRFKEIGEKSGLMIEYSDKVGWSLTSLQESTKELIKQIEVNDVFNLTRIYHKPVTVYKTNQDEVSFIDTNNDTNEITPEVTPVPKKKSNSKKYVCPKCNVIVRATKEVSIICGICNSKFVTDAS